MGSGPVDLPATTASVKTSLEPVSWCCMIDESEKRGVNFEPDFYYALPPFHLMNSGITWLKEQYNDGQEFSWRKAGIYLGFRVISYSCLPIVFNLISLIASAIITAFCFLFTQCCDNGRAFGWAAARTRASAGYLLESLFDLTLDFRKLTGSCCCPAGGRYLQV